MTQRNVESVIGRLLTDEDFLAAFLESPERSLRDLVERGMHLTSTEIAALTSIDVDLWTRTAREIDARLQKARWR